MPRTHQARPCCRCTSKRLLSQARGRKSPAYRSKAWPSAPVQEDKVRRRKGLREIQNAHIRLPRAPTLVLGERHGVTGAYALTVVPEAAGSKRGVRRTQRGAYRPLRARFG